MGKWNNVLVETKEYYYDNETGWIAQNSSAVDKTIAAMFLDFGIVCNPVTESNIISCAQKAGINEGLKYTALVRFFQAREEWNNVIKYAEQGVKHNSAYCFAYLGDCYQCGLGVNKNIDRAIEYFTKCINTNDTTGVNVNNIIADSYGSLGSIYANEKNDYTKAVYNWTKGAEYGDPTCIYNKAHMWITGDFGHEVNIATGVKYLKIAAEKRQKDALFFLALAYFNQKYYSGIKEYDLKGYISADSNKGFNLLNTIIDDCKITKDHLNHYVKKSIADCYLNGDGTQKNEYKAFEYYSEAANENNLGAIKMVALMYMQGIGVTQDKEKALYWLKRAADMGDKEAIDVLNDINKQNNSGGCYIATCVYGSYDCPEVWTLRRFRDFILDETVFGRLFIKLYYRISPTIVAKYGQNRMFRAFWRFALDRMVKQLRNKGISDTSYKDKY